MAAILTTDHYNDEPLNEVTQENILPLDALYVLMRSEHCISNATVSHDR
jgi:hypothetical protein